MFHKLFALVKILQDLNIECSPDSIKILNSSGSSITFQREDIYIHVAGNVYVTFEDVSSQITAAETRATSSSEQQNHFAADTVPL